MFPEEHNDGDVIIRQGDQGKNFYVVDAGTPEVYLRDKDSDTEKKVLSYTEGDSFGELALMYNAPRAATVKASGAVKLWALDRLTFRVILQDSTMKKRDMHKTFLEKVRQGGLYHFGCTYEAHCILLLLPCLCTCQVKILSNLSEYERLTIADSLVPESYPANTKIISQGEVGDKFYIIEKVTRLLLLLLLLSHCVHTLPAVSSRC